MKNLAILLISFLSLTSTSAQRWSSAFVGKPDSRALYASNVSKAIQNAWENELSSKDKKEMLLDEIIFGKDYESKETKSLENNKFVMSNIDEIEEVLGIKEDIKADPLKKKTEISFTNATVKITPTIETANVNAMGNADEVKDVIENNKFQPIKSTKIFDKSDNKTILSINNDEIDVDSVYSIPQITPTFPGGNNAMKSFFAKNIITPESNGKTVKGKVFIRFMVKKNGELTKIYMVKGLTDACNKEAIRVVKKMPTWVPASNEGVTVNSWHTLPIYFEIE